MKNVKNLGRLWGGCSPALGECKNFNPRARNFSVLAKTLAACTHLSSAVFQLPKSYSNHNCKKSSFLRTPPFIFCLPWGRPCDGNHAICSMDGKTIQCLPNPWQHMPIYLRTFPSYSNRKYKKSPLISRTAAHILLPLEMLMRLSRNRPYVPWTERHYSMHVPIHLEYFPSYTMLKSMRKSKNRYFYHILVSPGDAPGAITINGVCLEREFDAYKLSRCMCSSSYNRF